MTVVVMELPITVRIPRVDPGKGFLGLPPTELSRGLLGQGHTVYIIEVEAFGLESQIRRQFEDFERFHADMSLLIRGLPSEVRLRLGYALPPLPTTSWFADSAKALEERRAKLEAMLQKLLLHPEVVYDKAGRLWRFLGLHSAVPAAVSLLAATTCGPWMYSLWEASAEGEGLTPLKHSAVEDALLKVIANTVGENWELADGKQQGSMILACELLERIFGGGRGATTRPEVELRRRVDALVSLLLCTCPPTPPEFQRAPDDDGSDLKKRPLPQSCVVRDAAGAALLALARTDREAWQQALCSYLNASAMRHLVAVVEAGGCRSPASTLEGSGDGSESAAGRPLSMERLVAELLLRGFDGPVIDRFTESGLGIERKQLLNSLFASQDLFVKVAVGLLLSRLLCQPDYAEAAKAELGLATLCRELGPRARSLAEAGLGPLLREDELWTWLSRLVASSHSIVSGFALLVVVNVVQPSAALIVGTPGMQEALAVLVQPEADEAVRSLAAQTLLAVYRGEEASIPADPALVSAVCGALASATERSVARQADEHTSLGVGVAEARSQYGLVATTEAFCGHACEGAVRFQAEVEAWRTALAAADGAMEVAKHVDAACVACLGSHRGYWGTALSNLESEAAGGCTSDPTPELQLCEQLLEDERSKLELGTHQMEGLVQEKMDLTRQVSECNEEVQRWLLAAKDVEASEAQGGAVDLATCGPRPGTLGSGFSAEDCWRKHRGAVESLKVLRTQVEQVDLRLQELSDALPALRETSEVRAQGRQDLAAQADEQRRRHAAVLLEWGKVLDVGSTCDAELGNFAGRLAEAQSALRTERSHRSSLRGAIQGVVASLVALDGHLESLEARDSTESTEP